MMFNENKAYFLTIDYAKMVKLNLIRYYVRNAIPLLFTSRGQMLFATCNYPKGLQTR